MMSSPEMKRSTHDNWMCRTNMAWAMGMLLWWLASLVLYHRIHGKYNEKTHWYSTLIMFPEALLHTSDPL